MLKRSSPPKYDHLFLSNSETESDDDDYPRENYSKGNTIKRKFKRSNKKETTLDNGESIEEAFKEEPDIEVIEEARKYQEYMKQMLIPVPVIPDSSPSVLPFITWQDLAESMKKKYEQPLHYLTRRLLKQWDESRAKNEINPIGNVIHPTKAEATLWVVEEYNRQFASHYYIAKLWISDPNYRNFVDATILKF